MTSNPEMAALWASQIEAFMYRHNESVEALDFRTPDQVRGDALAELTHVGFDGVRLPATGAERPQLVVSINWEDLVKGLGTAALGPDMQPISASEARRLACDCNVLPIVMDSESKAVGYRPVIAQHSGAHQAIGH